MFDEQLIVVGTGIRTIGQMTMESIAWIKRAEKVLHIVSDPVAVALIESLNPEAESLNGLYKENQNRMITYEQMIDRVLSFVRDGKMTCLAAYGHPGVFAYPTHESVRRARAEGFKARMLPGISAEDCLFADMNIDPATAGCQSFEATDFMVSGRIVDPSSHLVLWQIGVLGDATFQPTGRYAVRGMSQLLTKLYGHGYSPYHTVYVYEAPVFPGVEPVIRPVALMALGQSGISPASTLYIPPATGPRVNYALMEAIRAGTLA